MNDNWSLGAFFPDMGCQLVISVNSDTRVAMLDTPTAEESGGVDRIQQNLRVGDGEEEFIKFNHVC